uniref:Rod-binding domain-containing protein n=1 Tax=Macrostomum lignano TaxID=282301 RepID=A0A1I8FNB5_9PLAT
MGIGPDAFNRSVHHLRLRRDAGAQKAECMRRREHQPGAAWAGGGAKNKVQQQTPEDAFMAMMKRMTAGKSLQCSRADVSAPELSVSVGSALGSRRSSVYAPTYGNTLSPNYSAPRPRRRRRRRLPTQRRRRSRNRRDR